MPGEPLIFVEVALVAGLAGDIKSLLDERAPLAKASEADTAVFFSISKTQDGLAGINFGNFLIKRVVEQLGAELKNIKTFATLSPVPGFMAWLGEWPEEIESVLLTAEERGELRSVLPDGLQLRDLPALLRRPGWADDKTFAGTVKPILLKWCVHYLLKVKSVRDPKTARDSVAHFHISNGARMERLNWLADTSRNGMEQSAGIMINYQYRENTMEGNHEAYSESGKIAASRKTKSLLGR